MFLRQFFVDGLGHSSYLLGSGGACAVIDPKRDVEDYIKAAAEEGFTITHILETHLHADFMSGHIDLAKRTGAKIYMPALAKAEFPHVSVKEGDVIAIGALHVRALDTPGHTPEMISYVVSDRERSDDPIAVFTGDTLFVNDVGRPDLFGETMAETLNKALYDSIYRKLMALPDGTIVYPSHGAGSLCGKDIGATRWSTIGHEKRNSMALKQKSYADFKKAVLADTPEPPIYFFRTSEINKKGPTPVSGLHGDTPLSPAQVKEILDKKGVVLDCRSIDAFAGSHIEGAVNAGISPAFPTWAGNFVPYDTDIVLVLQSPDDLYKALTMLYRVGHDEVAGHLMGGMASWHNAGMKESRLRLMTAEELKDELKQDKKLKVIDVRAQQEWRSGHIPGATHLPLMSLDKTAHLLNPEGKYAVICDSGYRASIAASVLRRHGIKDVSNVAGSMMAWKAKKYPVIK